MIRVFVCSPYAARGDNSIADNTVLAKRLCRALIDSYIAPFAPHLLYPQILEEAIAGERELGIQCGTAFISACHEVWVYDRLGISDGMQREIEHARSIGKTVNFAPALWENIDPKERPIASKVKHPRIEVLDVVTGEVIKAITLDVHNERHVKHLLASVMRNLDDSKYHARAVDCEPETNPATPIAQEVTK